MPVNSQGPKFRNPVVFLWNQSQLVDMPDDLLDTPVDTIFVEFEPTEGAVHKGNYVGGPGRAVAICVRKETFGGQWEVWLVQEVETGQFLLTSKWAFTRAIGSKWSAGLNYLLNLEFAVCLN